ncbi:Hypothetical predicted protein [Pelobates cultripes]|uniref:ZP domain-containing protein n=1 Tax=Pelobates cultripes TaxID=61616 RepID=A0AAD1SU71_PELCU|nr:Hypothetical predicted protein [Pelobates cultripes]
MAHSLGGSMKPKLMSNCVLGTWCLLLICLLCKLSDAAKTLDFPGSVSCRNDGLQIQKPKGIRLTQWRSLHVVDLAGDDFAGCDVFMDGKVANIPENCIEHELERRVLHIAFKDFTGQERVTYRVVCNDLQADEAIEGTVVNCTQDFMMIKFPRTLPQFDGEISQAVQSIPSKLFWDIGIYDGTRYVTVTTGQARQMGYVLKAEPDFLVIKAFFNASGLQIYKMENQNLYVGAVRLSSRFGAPKIVVDVPMVCVRSPPTCNETHMIFVIPPFGGILTSINLHGMDIPLDTQALQQYGITLDSLNGLHLYIKRNSLKDDIIDGTHWYSLSSLILTFQLGELTVPMQLTPKCSVASSPSISSCTKNGSMMFEIAEGFTQPKINLDTVVFGDGTCLPMRKTSSLVYKVPLNRCGTRKMFVDGKIYYENEAHALWKDFPPRQISRDSELRITVRCYYNPTANTNLIVNVGTLPPPLPTIGQGPLVFKLELFKDDSFGIAYGASQYPVMKILRDPLYFEISVLNRNDPNIELVLNDCWATMSLDPTAVPQWNVVVDGCQEVRDNFQTVFHPVLGVSLPNHRKRFEVKAFAFVTGGQASTSLSLMYVFPVDLLSLQCFNMQYSEPRLFPLYQKVSSIQEKEGTYTSSRPNTPKHSPYPFKTQFTAHITHTPYSPNLSKHTL